MRSLGNLSGHLPHPTAWSKTAGYAMYQAEHPIPTQPQKKLVGTTTTFPRVKRGK